MVSLLKMLLLVFFIWSLFSLDMNFKNSFILWIQSRYVFRIQFSISLFYVNIISERDLIGLSGNNLCLFKSEADVEEEINISNRVLRQCPRYTWRLIYLTRVLRQCPRYTRRLIYLTEFLDSVRGIHGD